MTPEVKWRQMSRALPREQKKWDMNLDLQSEVMWEGTPCLEKMWRRNSLASPGESIVSYVGMNMHCLERQSTMTRMDVNPDEGRRCSMESIDMEFHRCSGIGSCFNKP